MRTARSPSWALLRRPTAELPSSPSRLIPAMDDESWKASPTCWLCNRRAYKEADKHRLPAAAGEPHDLVVLNPDSGWVHESCCRQVRKSVGKVRTSASAEPPKRRSSRNAGPEPLAPLPPPPPRASFRPSSSGASGQLEPLSQGAYWDAPSSRRGEAVSPAGPRTSPLGPGTRAVSASSGTAASSTTLEDTPQLSSRAICSAAYARGWPRRWYVSKLAERLAPTIDT